MKVNLFENIKKKTVKSNEFTLYREEMLKFSRQRPMPGS